MASGGTFESAVVGTFQNVMGGTFVSDTPGTFDCAMGGTFRPLLSTSPLSRKQSCKWSLRHLGKIRITLFEPVMHLRCTGVIELVQLAIYKGFIF
jgi:hypothetical protein